MVLMSVCAVVAWLKILTKGEVVARVMGEVGSALGVVVVVGGVTVVEVGGAAVLVVVGGVSVGGGCDGVVARTVGGKGVRVLVGGGMVGVGGLNLTMEKQQVKQARTRKRSRGRQN